MSSMSGNWNKGIEEGNNKHLLRIGIIFLSIVSFFTTANGMREYIFIYDHAVAYAASAAIQGILLALSMHLPEYLKNIWTNSKRTPKETVSSEESEWPEEWWLQARLILLGIAKKVGSCLRRMGRFLGKILICVILVLLTMVTMFCSSWFSYVYIADIIHQDSWGTDSELLVQQTYRTELYNARDYAHAYCTFLEESVGEQILQVEELTRQLSDFTTGISVDWEDERNDYVTENGATAASYMSTVIDAMIAAMDRGASQTDRDLALTAIEDAKENIAERMESIQQNIETLNANITNYNNQIERLRNQINRAIEGTNTAALNEAMNNYVSLVSDMSRQQASLQSEYLDLDRALLRLPYYENQLGLTNSTSASAIRAELLRLQNEFFLPEPDQDKLLEIAVEIFGNIRNAVRNAAEGEMSDDSFTYSNLLIQMNQLTRELTDYSAIREIESELDQMILELRNGDMEDETGRSLESEGEPELNGSDGAGGQSEADNPDGAEGQSEADNPDGAEGQTEADNPDESEGQSEADNPDESEEQSGTEDSSEGTESQTAEANAGSGDDIIEEAGAWKREWGDRLEKLKAQISAMPMFSATEESYGETSGVLSENQLHILIGYNRDNSGKQLDEMIRRYISNHNAIYQGILYLQSPYRSLAIFALVMAVAFDLTGFVFGFVEVGGTGNDSIDDIELNIKSKKKKKKKKNMQVAFGNNSLEENDAQTTWSILETMNKYIVLTGDYECQDGVYYYKTFKNGRLYQWSVGDTRPYSQGIYVQEEGESKGEAVPASRQMLTFNHQSDGPKDGIFINCQLIYDEGSLLLWCNDEYEFLAGIDEYVPVHSYNPGSGENQTIPAKQLAAKMYDDQVIVVALNTRGTQIAAIYKIES